MVIPGLQVVLLGQEWIQSVRLLSCFDDRSYYIPIPLAVEAAEERLPGIGALAECSLSGLVGFLRFFRGAA
jgi:hypothetical protein